MIFDNHPLENLNRENDLFGLIDKAEFILKFLNKKLYVGDIAVKNKMFCVYGGWGTGKTTLLKFLEQNIDQKKYLPIFFEAWENEKDDNLALSLLDSIRGQLQEDGKFKQIKKKVYHTGLKFLKGFTKGVSVKMSTPIEVLGVTFSPKELFNEFDDNQKDPESFSESLKDFKTDFRRLEEALLKENNLEKEGRIIIFIDDLDRCEPENVLNLISAIKLFFTYGNRVCFFCGIDKEAVSKAIKSRYQEVIKSEEYLEKVFDITFNMPQRKHSLNKLFKSYFGETKVGKSNEELDLIFKEFLGDLQFENPRHVLKCLNKYTTLSYYLKEVATENHEFNNLSICDPEGKGYFSILFLFSSLSY